MACGDPRHWMDATGLKPKGIREALSVRRSTAQERMYAAFYFLQPLVIGITSVFFAATGAISWTIGYDTGVQLLERGGMGALVTGACPAV